MCALCRQWVSMFTAGSPDLAAQPAAAAVSSQPAVTALDEQTVAVSFVCLPSGTDPQAASTAACKTAHAGVCSV